MFQLLQQHSESLPVVDCPVLTVHNGHLDILFLAFPPCLDFGRMGTLSPSEIAPLPSTFFSAHDHKVGTDASYFKKKQKALVPNIWAT